MLRFGILGSIEVYDYEGRAVAVGGPRQVRLLALLLVHAGRAVSTDRLRDALWGAARAGAADKRLQMAVARLRKALDAVGAGAALRTTAGGYRLVVAPSELDAEVFETTAQAGHRALAGGELPNALEFLRRGARGLAGTGARRCQLRGLGTARDPPPGGTPARHHSGARRRDVAARAPRRRDWRI